MIKQIFKTHCEDCGEELVHLVGDMTETNEIIVDFLDGMDFHCNACDSTTYVEIQKYSG